MDLKDLAPVFYLNIVDYFSFDRTFLGRSVHNLYRIKNRPFKKMQFLQNVDYLPIQSIKVQIFFHFWIQHVKITQFTT